MANPGERSINIVTENKPKVLEGLGQKGTVAGTRIFPFLVMGNNATGGQSAPNSLLLRRNMAIPYVSRKGKQTVTPRTCIKRSSKYYYATT